MNDDMNTTPAEETEEEKPKMPESGDVPEVDKPEGETPAAL